MLKTGLVRFIIGAYDNVLNDTIGPIRVQNGALCRIVIGPIVARRCKRYSLDQRVVTQDQVEDIPNEVAGPEGVAWKDSARSRASPLQAIGRFIVVVKLEQGTCILVQL